MNSRGRLVLLPLGREWPGEDDRVLSFEQLIECCGGDLFRCFEAEPTMNPEQFISAHTTELFKHADEEIIIAVAPRSGPMSMGEVLGIRGWLEGELPFLHSALWVLFVNEEAELCIMRQLMEQGDFDTRFKSLEAPPPVWTRKRSPEQKFLVLLTRTCSPKAVSERAEEHFQVMQFRMADRHPATIPVSSDPPYESLNIPSSPRLPTGTGVSSSGLRFVLPGRSEEKK